MYSVSETIINNTIREYKTFNGKCNHLIIGADAFARIQDSKEIIRSGNNYKYSGCDVTIDYDHKEIVLAGLMEGMEYK